MEIILLLLTDAFARKVIERRLEASSWRQRGSRSSTSPWSALPIMAPGTSAMLRARRRDVALKPNRRLDRSSTRGMIYENEELRLRTINISAEVERGQDDIKKLRRENDALRRELWGLRDEYDKLEALLKRNEAYLNLDDSDGEKDDDEDGDRSEYSEPEEEDEEEESGEEETPGNQKNGRDAYQAQPNQPSAAKEVEFDLLSIVPEETDENQTDSQSQDDNEQRSPAVARRMYGYPVVDPLTGRPCGVMLPVDEASAAAAVAEISGAVDDVFLQPRGGPDLFVEGAYSMEPTAMAEEPNEASQQYTVECLPASPTIVVSKEDTPPPAHVDTPAVDTLFARKPFGATLRERRKSALTLQIPPTFTQTVQASECENEDQSNIAVLLTGVPKEATDAQVLAGLAPFGAVVGPIERPAGPSGDERIARLRRPPQQRGLLPQDVTVAGTRVPLRALDTTAARDNTTKTGKPFRSQLQVRLKSPAATLPLRRVPSVDCPDSPSGVLPRAASANTLQNPPQQAIPGQVAPAPGRVVGVPGPIPGTQVQTPAAAIPLLPRAEWPVSPRFQNPNTLRRPVAPGRAVPVPLLPATAPVNVPVTLPGVPGSGPLPAVPGSATVPGITVPGVTIPGVPFSGVTVPVVPVPVPVTVQGGTVAVTAPATATECPAGMNGMPGSVPSQSQNGTSGANHVTPQPVTATPSQTNPAFNNAINDAVERSQERLEVPDNQNPATASATASPATVRRNTKRNLLRKQSSEESHGALATPSPGQARKKPLRNCKQSSVTETTTGGSTSSTSVNAPTGLCAPPSPSTAVADHSQSSSSGQDSPHKSDRRRRVSIYLNRRPKKTGASQQLLHSGGSGDGGGDCSPYDHGATTSERERTASASSRDSPWNSRPGPKRNDRRDSVDSGKVPWCGCWGNGCL